PSPTSVLFALRSRCGLYRSRRSRSGVCVAGKGVSGESAPDAVSQDQSIIRSAPFRSSICRVDRTNETVRYAQQTVIVRTSIRGRLRVAGYLLYTCAMASSVHGQTTGQIAGIIKDQTGAVMVAAEVPFVR